MASTTNSAAPDLSASPRRRTPRWPELGAVAVITALFAVLYIVLAARLNSYHSFWSPDTGVRFQAIRNWTHTGNLAYLTYESADVDPTAQFHPLGRVQGPDFIDGYVLELPKGLAPVFPLLFDWISGMEYRTFGFGGLTILPIAAGVATLPLTYMLACLLGLRSRVLIIVLLGIGSPLLIYSVVFWDHSVHMALVAIAGIFVLRGLETGKLQFGLLAGLTLGVGLQFHELFGTLFVALEVSALLWVQRRKLRMTAIGIILGFAPLLAVWVYVNWSVYGLPAGVHFEIGREIARSPRFADDMRPHELFIQMLVQWIGYEPGWGWRPIEMVGLLGAAFVICMAIGGKALRVAPFAALLLIPIVLGFLARVMWAHGLFEATPILFAALAFFGFSRTRPGYDESAGAAMFYRWIGTAYLIFAAIIIVNPQGTGMDWGNRYQLTVLPLLAVLAARAFEGLIRGVDPKPLLPAVASAITGLAAVGIYSEYRAYSEVAGRMEGWGHYAPAVLSLPDEPVVTDISHFGAYFVEKAPARMFLVRHPEVDGPAFFAILDRLHANEFTYAGQPEGLDAMRDAALRARDPFIQGQDWPSPATGYRFYRRSAFGPGGPPF